MSSFEFTVKELDMELIAREAQASLAAFSSSRIKRVRRSGKQTSGQLNRCITRAISRR
ncbi:MAG TPA: hypothetical protein VK469_14170 [Candidatus Kapabacteria bacterium]|nr:hypothetical protein [Candidatus Kapabacteria bacterium]